MTQHLTNDGQSFDARALLGWYLAAGVNEAIADAPIDRFSQSQAVPLPQSATQAQAPQTATARQGPAAVRPAAAPRVLASTQIAADCKSLEDLKAAINSYEECGLKQTALSTVFADGVPTAKVMCVGDMPDKDDDRTGTPFSGQAGQLLDKMLAAIGLDRSENAYLGTVIPWRPPGNRAPSPMELAHCLPFIRRHIELVAPDFLICLGALPATALLGIEASISKLHGRWKTLEIGQRNIQVLPIYAPSYLLRQPRLKADAWKDLLSLSEKLDAKNKGDNA
ncbi:DNA polymerase [Iodidimonas gelatinilytica]|uniref:Type-4 uracil-DNA glycosylase n=1 Tax=Iodidimonas gelatinilytica TaxID=1236966 RepID=A0A5A7MUS4_9PROT|nr:uracil-DNA glycosylase [Iodidimonas gelatinilytica]GEQ98798.1 DNA polymerase [Iodidimonas gelatinilytica]GER01335.1 DNA polymerase [Iodidimonas gelatinilytica]